jgi:HlyD family secretion protein
MKKTLKILLAGILSVMMLTGVLTGCSQASAESSTTSQYTDYTVTSGELKNTLSLEGYLTPVKTVTITTDQTSKVAKIIKKKGKVVKKDANIILLENGNTIKAPAKGKITKLNVAVGDRVDSSVTVGTMYDYSTKTTTSSGMSSTTSYDTVNITADTSSYITEIKVKAGDKVAEGAVIATLENGNSVFAPFAGTVSTVNVEAGDKVEAETQLASLVDSSNFYIDVSVNEIDAEQLEVGQSVDITVNALDLTTTGKVSEISVEGTVSNSTTTFTVKISLDEQNEKFKTNMSAAVDILIADVTDAISVPIDAVTTTNGKKYLMVKKDSAYTATEVETGISNDSYVQITSGLAAGDIVGVENGTSSSMGGMMGGGMMGGGTGGGQPPSGGGQGGGQPPSGGGN